IDSHYGTSSDRAFIVGSDRSICVLLQKATILEREVIRRGLHRPTENAPVQGHRDELAGHVERLRRVFGDLQRTPLPDTPALLNEAIARGAQELSTIELGDRGVVVDQLERLDVDLLRAARASLPAELMPSLRAEADEELDVFRLG